MSAAPPDQPRTLRSQWLGAVELLPGDPPVARRDLRVVAWWLRPLARWLARREAAVLAVLAGDRAFPRLLSWDGMELRRSAIAGASLAEAGADAAWLRSARRALGRMHRRGVAHNDLAREPNWLVTPDSGAAIIDFELAWHDADRGWLYRLMAREDLRHLLKHKRCYCPARLSARERAWLARPTLAARAWRRTVLPVVRGLGRLGRS